jgi:hypothetical protein
MTNRKTNTNRIATSQRAHVVRVVRGDRTPLAGRSLR